jgi:hypothetical protein
MQFSHTIPQEEKCLKGHQCIRLSSVHRLTYIHIPYFIKNQTLLHTHTHTHTPSVETEYTALQSDLIQQVVAAVTQQRQEVVEEEGAREIVNPALLGIEVQSTVCG